MWCPGRVCRLRCGCDHRLWRRKSGDRLRPCSPTSAAGICPDSIRLFGWLCCHDTVIPFVTGSRYDSDILLLIAAASFTMMGLAPGLCTGCLLIDRPFPGNIMPTRRGKLLLLLPAVQTNVLCRSIVSTSCQSCAASSIS